MINMTDLEKRVEKWATSLEGQRILTESLDRAKRAVQFIEDAVRIDPDVHNRPTTI